MTTALNAATVFPVPGDGDSPVTLTREYLTNVLATASGAEVRSGLRTIPRRTLAFTALFENAVLAGQFRALWVNATERLRYTVPLWPRYTVPTAFPDASTITSDCADRGFVTGPKAAILWQSETAYELVDVASVADDGVTLSTPIAGAYTIGAVRLVPAMAAWLEPPTLEQLALDVERVPLSFIEELPGVAGIDPTAGLAETPVAATITRESIFTASPWGPLHAAAVRVTVFDAAGNRIPRAPLTWTVTPSSNVASPIVTFPGDGSVIAADFAGNSFADFAVHVVSGAASLDFSFQ